MLGRAVLAEARRRGWPALALPRATADVTDAASLAYWVDSFHPEVVVNCAAFTRVDDCERERERARLVNGEAVGLVAAAARRGRARLLQVSTDYVFDGEARAAPYREEDPTAPRSVYGQSKRLGEERALAGERALVVRTSWLFGAGGPNFVAAITAQIDRIDRGARPLRVVADQTGAPTYTPFLARALLDLAPGDAAGIVHYRNQPPVSWYSFAAAIARWWPGPQGTVEVVPVTTAEFPRPAPRPAWSVLAVERAGARRGRPGGGGGGGVGERGGQMRDERQGRTR